MCVKFKLPPNLWSWSSQKPYTGIEEHAEFFFFFLLFCRKFTFLGLTKTVEQINKLSPGNDNDENE